MIYNYTNYKESSCLVHISLFTEADDYSDGSCYSRNTSFDRFSTRTLPVRRKRQQSLDKSYGNYKSCPGHNSASSYEQAYLSRSPAKRRLDFCLKRRANSVQLPKRTFSAPCELKDMAECDENETDVDLLDVDQRENESSCSTSQNSSVDSCYSELSSLPDRRRTSCHSCCSSTGHDGIYSIFDIVGESFEARFPWQRDVATQCNIVVDCCRDWSVSRRCSSHNGLNSPDSQQLLTLRKAKLHRRPHSIGCVENEPYDEELLRVRFEHSQQPRKSDSCLQVSPRANRRRSSPFYLDDPGSGSVSDLGSISEIPDYER